MQNEKYDVIVFGGVCCDMIFSGLDGFPREGEEVWAGGLKLTVGGAFNVAAAAARLNLRTGLPSALGTDMLSAFVRETARREAVDMSLFLEVPEEYEQVSAVFNFAKERSFVSYAADSRAGELDAHIERIIGTRDAAVGVFGISPSEAWIRNMRRMRARGARIVLDCCWNEEILNSLKLKEQIEASDYFLPNLKEAQTITGETDPERAAQVLANFCPNVIIKMGAEGALSLIGGELRRYSACSFGPAVDTTGAGDNFVAGFCYGLVHGLSLEESIRCGLLCGSKSVLAVGGFTASLYESELRYLLAHGVPGACDAQGEEAEG